MRNDGEASEAGESACTPGGEGAPATRAKETERASGAVRRARGAPPKRKSAEAATTTSPDRTRRAPKTKGRSAGKAAPSRGTVMRTGRAAGDDDAACVSPAADSIPPILASNVPFGERPTQTEPGPPEDF